MPPENKGATKVIRTFVAQIDGLRATCVKRMHDPHASDFIPGVMAGLTDRPLVAGLNADVPGRFLRLRRIGTVYLERRRSKIV
jgi:hypothetical protein